MSLRTDGITRPVPRELANLSNLKELWLAGNSLTGAIPRELGNQIALEYLNLDHNQLVGEIPPELGRLVKLEYLDLDFNRLTGLCAPSTSSLTGWLERIDSWSGPRCGSFDLEMRFTGAVSSTVRLRLRDARDDWEEILANRELDNIALNTTVSCGGLSGFVGTMDALVPTMFHEMGHALGFRGYWFHHDWVDSLSAADPHFNSRANWRSRPSMRPGVPITRGRRCRSVTVAVVACLTAPPPGAAP